MLTITLDRPDCLNAFTPQMADELISAYDSADDSEDVRAIILTGAGRGFCSGADLSGGAATFDFSRRATVATSEEDPAGCSGIRVPRDNAGRVTLRMLRSLKPIIAAINGPAVGVGATMSLAADFRLVSDLAKIGFVFVRRGLVPEGLSTYLLPRTVGLQRSLEWMLTGRLLTPTEALEGGLARSIHAHDRLLADAKTLAREICEHTSPVSVALTRQMLWAGQGLPDMMDAHRLESRCMNFRGKSADAKEGGRSFLERRQPTFADQVGRDMPEFFPWWSEPPF